MTIKTLRRLENTTIRLGGCGDNWHMTWAEDDRQYVSLCDGSGFPGMPSKDYNSRIYAVSGHPSEVTFEYIPGYPDLINKWGTSFSSRYYGFGILALDGKIYQFLSTPNHPFHEPHPRFVGVKLIYSQDNGKSWCNQNGSEPVTWESFEQRSSEDMIFFYEPNDTFSLVTVLQMGMNYKYNRDRFVYLYAPNGNTEGTMNQLVMCRVPQDRILERSAYEFFVNCDLGGDAEWSEKIEDRGIVHTFPSGWVNRSLHPYAWHPSVVYYSPFDMYLMANWGMGCKANGEWFGKPSYLGFWTSLSPWGPWTQLYEETEWIPAYDRNSRAYQPQIVPKWISNDGRSFWLIWTDFQTVDGKRPYYSMNVQKVEVLMS